VDPDVYTTYFDDRPFGLVGSVTAYTRPMVDVASRVRARVVTNPDVGTLDRVEVGTSVDLVSGAGEMPWLGFSYTASYRPSSEFRDRTFLRHMLGASATFWRWHI